MSRILSVAMIVVIALSAVLGWQLHKRNTVISQQDRVIGKLNQQLSDKTGQLLAVGLMARANDSLQLRLQQRNAELAAAVASRDQKIKALINENPEVKRWADTRLPDDVIRLQQRPAITGAAGYHAYLSGDNPLYAASKSAGHKR
ncbi:Rz-like lysis system protein LysB [Citrobacter freundii]|uniref:Rz-like lysis system protein LysB n=1 Tax=Citrobacter freundii TaxID=546 RepID=UPI0017849342|nr:Rz-like lysis system protein LysB [Citrobacter freundii]ELQ7794646.1 LysB family phage lysis regulatory protein [Citrobacter freundii]MBE0099024.1 LysB family phage lysis regulatory protein [Citrobacter freundii]MEA8857462.1 Rz-like lysis system protein LysB [Citrobacter freundii]MEB1001340.1 Rz-like lysis system protein LysB [Citrobacter freundii]